MKPDHPDEHDYCTLLLAEEYWSFTGNNNCFPVFSKEIYQD
jgi:hypothetical protein